MNSHVLIYYEILKPNVRDAKTATEPPVNLRKAKEYSIIDVFSTSNENAAPLVCIFLHQKNLQKKKSQK